MRLVLIIIMFLVGIDISFGAYSEGYRMGVVSKLSKKGIINKSLEGQLLMGREGTPYIKTYSCGSGKEKKICKETINPWYFSGLEEIYHKVKLYAGEYVWVKYKEAHFNTGVNYDTPYIIEKIDNVTRTYPQISNCSERGNGSKSKGFRMGRIVKASLKGALVNTYEITIQVGNSGNQFKNMSIKTKKMFECSLEYLKSGKKVKIEYKESIVNLSLRDTNYIVTNIEALKDI